MKGAIMAYKSHKFGKRNGKKHFNAVGVRTAYYYPVYLLDLFFCYFTEKHLFILA